MSRRAQARVAGIMLGLAEAEQRLQLHEQTGLIEDAELAFAELLEVGIHWQLEQSR